MIQDDFRRYAAAANRSMKRDYPPGVSGAASEFARQRAGSNGQLSLEQAVAALVATHRALFLTARKLPSQQAKYRSLMDKVRLEQRAVTNRLLKERGSRIYAPIEARFKAASGQLREAHSRAEKALSNFKDGRELLNAFAAIISALAV